MSVVTRIQSRVPWEDYLALPGASITRLKELRRSPLHYRHRLQHPKETPALSLGRAAHCAVLEPERFDRDHAVWKRRTRSEAMAPRNGKAWEEFKAEHDGKTILTADEYEEAMAMQAAIRGNPDAMRYLEQGDPEVTMQWMARGLTCKGRIDWLTHADGRVVIVGLKTARDCRPFQFGNQAARLGYHLQWAYYKDGYEAITGNRDVKMVEIVVEPEAPHAQVVYEIPEDVMLQGFDEYMALLEILEECERNNAWPGPSPGEQILTLPSWAYPSDEDLSDLGLEQ